MHVCLSWVNFGRFECGPRIWHAHKKESFSGIRRRLWKQVLLPLFSIQFSLTSRRLCPSLTKVCYIDLNWMCAFHEHVAGFSSLWVIGYMEEKGYNVANLAQGFQLCRAQLFDVLCQRILVVICYNVVGSPAVCCTVDEDSAS